MTRIPIFPDGQEARLMGVTHSQETCIRNLHRIERSSIRSILCKFLVPETFKHNRLIKPHNFGHLMRR